MIPPTGACVDGRVFMIFPAPNPLATGRLITARRFFNTIPKLATFRGE